MTSSESSSGASHKTNRLAGEGRGIATGTVTKVYKRSGDFDVRAN